MDREDAQIPAHLWRSDSSSSSLCPHGPAPWSSPRPSSSPRAASPSSPTRRGVPRIPPLTPPSGYTAPRAEALLHAESQSDWDEPEWVYAWSESQTAENRSYQTNTLAVSVNLVLSQSHSLTGCTWTPGWWGPRCGWGVCSKFLRSSPLAPQHSLIDKMRRSNGKEEDLCDKLCHDARRWFTGLHTAETNPQKLTEIQTRWSRNWGEAQQTQTGLQKETQGWKTQWHQEQQNRQRGKKKIKDTREGGIMKDRWN